MRVLVLGGDGFTGWPTALHLSASGHDVAIIDNLSRRNIDNELGTNSLTPIASIHDRLVAWEEVSGKHVEFMNVDLDATWGMWVTRAVETADAVVHFAEQRAAPYSMKSPYAKAYTVRNNTLATHNLLVACAAAPYPPHIVHLGTMGVYGYGTTGEKIPEGYLGDGSRHPTSPGSIYHMTKCLDAEMFAYYARNDALRITDLHQGIVWGTNTPETQSHPALVNRFDYDGDYGTVLNRFLAQAAAGYPLTVHGTGGQTRAFIHIQDTVECIRLAIENPPERGDRVLIRNQMTECHRVDHLAKLVASLMGAEIAYTPNPRNEAAENELMVSNDSFLKLGLKPKMLSKDLMTEIHETAYQYRDRIDTDLIPCTSTWTGNQQPGIP